MGVNVNAVIFVGKHTKDPREYFTEEQLEDFDGDWQEHGIDSKLEVHPVSEYSDEGWYVGYKVAGNNPFDVSNKIAKYAIEFEELTGKKPEFINWAYYW